jgi:uncharacterized protein (DUF2141 family)
MSFPSQEEKRMKSIYRVSIFLIVLCAAAQASADDTRYRGFTVATLDRSTLEEAVTKWGANQVRYMMCPVWQKGTFPSYTISWNYILSNLATGLDNAKALGLAVVLDLHQLPDDTPVLYSSDPNQDSHLWWYDQDNLNLMINCWKQVANICKNRDQVIWFDLWNEPLDWTTVHSSPSYPPEWPSWAQQVISEIRKIDTRHPIAIEPGPGMLSWGFDGFPLLSDPYQELIYSVHIYQPVGYSHQGVDGTTIYSWPETLGGSTGLTWLEGEYTDAINFQQLHGVRIWVGEFSAPRWAPGSAAYLKDCMDLCEKYGWDWSYHALCETSVWNLEDTNEVDLYDANGNYVQTGLAQAGSGLYYAPYGTTPVVPVVQPAGFTNRGDVVRGYLELNASDEIHVLHGIPLGNFNFLETPTQLAPNTSNPGGWWGKHNDDAASVLLVGDIGKSSRHCELRTDWMERQASVWYIDYFPTPVDTSWEVRGDLQWNGGTSGGTSKSLSLIPGEDPNVAGYFSLRFYGNQIAWSTPTASGTFTSATGLDGTYRQVSIAYNPLSGYCYAKLGTETIFSTSTTSGLAIRTIRFSTVFPTGTYDPGTLSIDNLTAVVQSVNLPGDANGDGMVDVGDLGILAANYGLAGKTWANGDFNGDGKVDVGDLGILAANYGRGVVYATLDFNADYAQAFGTTVSEEEISNEQEISGSACSLLGLPLVIGVFLIGLMLVKFESR